MERFRSHQRTLRDWLGNRNLQHALGIVLGTTVFCLLALRAPRDFADDATPTIPHVTVVVAVALGVISLIAVGHSVDHLTHSVQVGSVADRVATDTIAVVSRADEIPAGQSPKSIPSSEPSTIANHLDIPPSTTAIETATAGWIQQVDENAILAALPERATAFVPVSIGGFVPAGAPLVWVASSLQLDDSARNQLLDAFRGHAPRARRTDRPIDNAIVTTLATALTASWSSGEVAQFEMLGASVASGSQAVTEPG